MNNTFCILPLLLVVMLTSCSPASSELKSKNALNEYDIKTYEHIDWNDVFSQKDHNYLIFFYSDTCEHCHEIMGDVCSFIDDGILKTYVMDIKNTITKVPVRKDGKEEETIGMTNIDDLFIRGTPSIIEIKKESVADHKAGKEKCLTLLTNKRLLHKT